MKFIVDENVSLTVVELLKALNFTAIPIASREYTGLKDEAIYAMALRENALIITRDHHFTNSIKFPPEKTKGIIYIRAGNLTSEEESAIVGKFIRSANLKEIQGKLVTLYRSETKIRPS